MGTYFKTETDVVQNLINDFFFLILNLSEKIWGYGLISKKRKLCMQNLTKEQKLPPTVILQQAIFRIYLFCACG